MRPQFTCPNCGRPISQGAKFCSNCGANLVWPEQPTSQNYQRPSQMPPQGNSSAGAVFLTILVTLALVIAGFFIALNSHIISFYNGPVIVTQTSTVTPSPVQSPYITFNVSPGVITSGQTTTLLWNVSGADSVSIDQGIGNVPVSGSRVISPTSTTTYTLTAVNTSSSLTASITVTVNQVSLPVITGFAANPSAITPGQSTTLLWNTTGATSVSINQGIGVVVANGSQSVSPTTTTTYVLTATNSSGSTTATTTITVNQVALPTINLFTATPSTINVGLSSTLSWDVSGATSVSIDQGIGAVGSSGNRQVAPSQTTSYTLTATNSSGSVTASTIITVNQTSLPIITSFSVSPVTINSGGSTTLSWNVTGATSVSIDQGIGSVATTGSRTFVLSATTTFNLTATNSGGTVFASATVTVVQAGLPVIYLFTANPMTVSPGGTSTLSWNVSGATTVSIDNGIGIVTAIGTRQVTLAQTTTYTMTATNGSGSVTASTIISASQIGYPTITNFYASPATINPGGSTVLSWSTSGATNVSLNQGIGPVSPTGTLTVVLSATTTFNLTATNSIGSVSASTTVTVVQSGLPIISFTASPTAVSPSGTSTLSWSVTGATNVSIDGGIGSVLASGTRAVTVTNNITYTLTAGNSVGTSTATVTIIISAIPLPVIISFTADRTTVPPGGSTAVNFSWNIPGADHITINGVTPTLNFAYTDYPASTTTYILTAYNSAGAYVTSSPITITVQ